MAIKRIDNILDGSGVVREEEPEPIPAVVYDGDKDFILFSGFPSCDDYPIFLSTWRIENGKWTLASYGPVTAPLPE